jgi:hypothetical protein
MANEPSIQQAMEAVRKDRRRADELEDSHVTPGEGRATTTLQILAFIALIVAIASAVFGESEGFAISGAAFLLTGIWISVIRSRACQRAWHRELMAALRPRRPETLSQKKSLTPPGALR